MYYLVFTQNSVTMWTTLVMTRVCGHKSGEMTTAPVTYTPPFTISPVLNNGYKSNTTKARQHTGQYCFNRELPALMTSAIFYPVKYNVLYVQATLSYHMGPSALVSYSLIRTNCEQTWEERNVLYQWTTSKRRHKHTQSCRWMKPYSYSSPPSYLKKKKKNNPPWWC